MSRPVESTAAFCSKPSPSGRLNDCPYWASRQPAPFEVDVAGVVKDDLKFLALRAALEVVAKNNGNTLFQQFDIWEGAA